MTDETAKAAQGEPTASDTAWGGLLTFAFIGAVAWFFTWGPGRTPDSFTSSDLIAKMEAAGIECEVEGSFNPPGPYATVYERGSCRTEEGPVLFFLYDDSQSSAALPDYVERYEGAYVIADDTRNWALVSESSQADEIASAVDGEAEYIDPQPVAPMGSTGGDLDCGSPGGGMNVPVQPGDPHGLDADGDGIGCET